VSAANCTAPPTASAGQYATAAEIVELMWPRLLVSEWIFCPLFVTGDTCLSGGGLCRLQPVPLLVSVTDPTQPVHGYIQSCHDDGSVSGTDDTWPL